MTPRFKHNCTSCVLLGTESGDDYYLCPPPPGAMGEGVITIRSGDALDAYISVPVSIARQRIKYVGGSGMKLYQDPFAEAVFLAEKQGLLKKTFDMTIASTGGLQTFIKGLVLPPREMSLEEQLLLQNFLTKRMLREYTGVQLTADLHKEIVARLTEWLKEWELIRA